MEESLSARQFIERFHLPQLVRISSLEGGSARQCDSKAKSSKLSSIDQQQQQQQQQVARLEPRRRISKQTSRSFVALAAPASGIAAGQSNPSASRRHQLEQSDADWTYAPGKCRAAESSGSSSLHWAPREPADEQLEQSGHSSLMLIGHQQQQQLGPTLRLLPRVKLQVPPADLERGGVQPLLKTKANEQFKPRRGRREAEITLMPASARPALSKLQLDQPFLLYKAYRKLEVCAYAIDLNNELNDKSGDPIFLPHNYQGWFTLLPSSEQANCSAGRREPLGSIDQVCHSAGQIFLTRDELLGYQLPSKLSQLTKLKNHQLLAVPLAINLDNSFSGRQGRRLAATKGTPDSQKQQNKSKSSAGISNLEQIVIPAGQVLRICGIYEDVLPLIERSNRNLAAKKQPQQEQPALVAFPVHPGASLVSSYEPQAEGRLYQRHNGPQAVYQANGQPFSQQAPTSKLTRREQRLRMLRASQQQQQQQHQQQNYGPTSQVISAQATPVVPPLIYSTKPEVTASQSLVASSQTRRYARCVLVSEHSLDRMTGCAPSLAREQLRVGENLKENRRANAEAEEHQEIEVLVPVDQVGRFYLCATSQTLASEWLSGCQDCSALAGGQQVPAPGQLVFRLSQIIYLINLNKRLSAGAAAGSPQISNSSCSSCSGQRSLQPMQQQQRSHGSWRPLSSSFALPLQVELVIGPRPATFSPSMFGLTSTMDSYFSRESNVGAHALACKLNRNSLWASPWQPEVIKPARANAPICVCPQQVKAAGASANTDQQLAWFSATLRLESIAKRDVLLACTIKQAPLEHLEAGRFALAGSELIQREQDALGEPLAFSSGQACKSVGPKSSLSRLRACRSLISLNGRKKRNRPQIPSSMMVDCPSAPRGGATGWREQTAAELDSPQPPGHLGEPLNDEQAGANQRAPIILLEFDCNDPELKLKRTFVEQSLPSASIPDLVLRRMHFCQANSSCWERQLKLSNSSLSRDFDAHKDELRAAQQHQLQVEHKQSSSRLASERAKSLSQSSFLSERCQFDASSYQRTISNKSGGGGGGGGGRQQAACSYVDSARGVQAQAGQLDQPVASSTASSSRSSSGVSSSGEPLQMLRHELGQSSASRDSLALSKSDSSSSSAATSAASDRQQQQQRRCRAQHGTGNEFTGRLATTKQQQQQQVGETSTAAAVDGDFNLKQQQRQSADFSPCSSSASSVANAGGAKSSSSRLLRLVHKILPIGVAGKPLEMAGGAGELAAVAKPIALQPAPAHSQRRLLMAELSGRFKSHETAPAEMDERALATTSTTTLMNSQKLHRRLLTGSERHLPAELMESLLQEEEQQQQQQDLESRLELERKGSASSSSSHLYESLERLNESLALAGQKVSGAGPKLDVAGPANRFQSTPASGRLQQQRRRQAAAERPDGGLALVAGKDGGDAGQQESRLQRQMRRVRSQSNEAAAGQTRVGLQQAAQNHLHGRLDEWWRTSASNSLAGDDDASAPTESSHRIELAAKKLCSGKAQAKRLALSWRQKLAGRRHRSNGSKKATSASSEQDTANESSHSQPAKDEKQKQKQKLGGLRGHSRADPADRCRADVDHKLDMEPVSIEACDGPEMEASSCDELADFSGRCGSPPPPAARAPTANNATGQQPTTSSASFCSSSASTSSSCSLASSSERTDRDKNNEQASKQLQAIERRRKPQQSGQESIYVNLGQPNSDSAAAGCQVSSSSGSSASGREELERLAEVVRRKSRGTQQLVSRMERKLAKLRGRCELRQQVAKRGELRSLGWEPAHELLGDRLPPRNATATRSCDLSSGPMSLPCIEPSRCNGAAKASEQQRPGSSLSSSSSINFSSSSSLQDGRSSASGSCARQAQTVALFANKTQAPDEQQRSKVTHSNSCDLSASLGAGGAGGQPVPLSDCSSSSSSSAGSGAGEQQKVPSSAQMWAPERLVTLDRVQQANVLDDIDDEWT